MMVYDGLCDMVQLGYLTLSSFNHLRHAMKLLTSLNFARLLSASGRDNGLSSGSNPLWKLAEVIQQTHDQQLETDTSNLCISNVYFHNLFPDHGLMLLMHKMKTASLPCTPSEHQTAKTEAAATMMRCIVGKSQKQADD